MNYYGNNRRALFRNYGKQVVDLLENPLNFLSQNRANMAPIRSRSRPVYNTPRSTPGRSVSRGRRSTRSFSMDTRSAGAPSTVSTRSRSVGGKILSQSAGSNVVASAMKKKGKKVKKEGRKKRVRISRKFKKMVNQVLSTKGPVGFMIEHVPGFNIAPLDNQQNVGIFGIRSYEGIVGWKFTPTYIKYVYDILYNKYAYPATAYTDVRRLVGTDQIDNLQIHVLEQYYIVKMKNNSARTLEIKLWDISPKFTQSNFETFNIQSFINSALSDTSPLGPPGTRFQQGRENPTGNTINDIGMNPKFISAFTQNFTCDETIIKLEPGKEYYHKVMGPNDKMYKYNKFKRDGQYVDVMPFCKTTMFSLVSDLSTTSTAGTAGRWTDIQSPSPFGLLNEVQYFTKIKCPDQTGFQIMDPQYNQGGAIGNIQPLSQKGYCYAVKYWGRAQDNLGAVVDIEDENPQAQAANGL